MHENDFLATDCLFQWNTMMCPIKVNSNTIELIMHTFCYFTLDLLCVSLSRFELGTFSSWSRWHTKVPLCFPNIFGIRIWLKKFLEDRFIDCWVQYIFRPGLGFLKSVTVVVYFDQQLGMLLADQNLLFQHLCFFLC